MSKRQFTTETTAQRWKRRRLLERKESGQTLIFIVIVLVVLVFVVLAIYDTHHIITQRVRAQNAADAAALTGAKWQMNTLNMIGELNLLKATAIIYREVPPGFSGHSMQHVLNSLTQMQRRLQFVGPMLGVLEAQQGAKLNGVRARPDLAERLRRRADLLRRLADAGAITQTGYPGWPYDYADMLEAIAEAGVAAEFVNSQYAEGWLEFTNPLAAEYLGRQAFYHAIAARDWCFLEDLLKNQNYTDFTFWGSVTVHVPPLEGSEFLNVGVTFRSKYWLLNPNNLPIPDRLVLTSILADMARERGLRLTSLWPTYTIISLFPLRIISLEPTWAVYSASRWRPFGEGADAPPPSETLVANIRPEFDYSGPDAAARVAIEPNITMSLRPRSETPVLQPPPYTGWLPAGWQAPVQHDLAEMRQLSEKETVVSIASAKPFGRINLGGQYVAPHAFRMVLPVFEEVRLIPIVYSSGGTGFDDGSWDEHRFFHLPIYLRDGPEFLPTTCFYCRQLRLWEDPGFRMIGLEWLMSNSCPPLTIPQPGPGPGGGGGIFPQPRPGGVRIPH